MSNERISASPNELLNRVMRAAVISPQEVEAAADNNPPDWIMEDRHAEMSSMTNPDVGQPLSPDALNSGVTTTPPCDFNDAVISGDSSGLTISGYGSGIVLSDCEHANPANISFSSSMGLDSNTIDTIADRVSERIQDQRLAPVREVLKTTAARVTVKIGDLTVNYPHVRCTRYSQAGSMLELEFVGLSSQGHEMTGSSLQVEPPAEGERPTRKIRMGANAPAATIPCYEVIAHCHACGLSDMYSLPQGTAVKKHPCKRCKNPTLFTVPVCGPGVVDKEVALRQVAVYKQGWADGQACLEDNIRIHNTVVDDINNRRRQPAGRDAAIVHEMVRRELRARPAVPTTLSERVIGVLPSIVNILSVLGEYLGYGDRDNGRTTSTEAAAGPTPDAGDASHQISG